MNKELEKLPPGEIERRSFEIIESELLRPLDPELAPIIKRVIHTTADFDFADTLCFSKKALSAGLAALRAGERIVTDTNMAKAGINKAALADLRTEALCFMADEDIALEAKRRGSTRAVASMDKAALLPGRPVFAVGNAPTALVRLYELINEGRLSPSLIIGVPVGFVNVVRSKELIMQTGVPYIVARGRKGGSSVAAAIVNALIYQLTEPQCVHAADPMTGLYEEPFSRRFEKTGRSGIMKPPEKKAGFFRHTECEYFPCHSTNRPEDFNCLFCYCPLYSLGERCGGNYSYTEKGIKDCSRCLFPHERSNYSAVMNRFSEIAEIAGKKDGASK